MLYPPTGNASFQIHVRLTRNTPLYTVDRRVCSAQLDRCWCAVLGLGGSRACCALRVGSLSTASISRRSLREESSSSSWFRHVGALQSSEARYRTTVCTVAGKGSGVKRAVLSLELGYHAQCVPPTGRHVPLGEYPDTAAEAQGFQKRRWWVFVTETSSGYTSKRVYFCAKRVAITLHSHFPPVKTYTPLPETTANP